MALDHSFYISTHLSPENLLRLFLMNLGKLKDLKEDCEASTDNFYAMANTVSGRSREIFQETYGFDANVYLTFRTWADVSVEATAEIVRGTLAICRTLTGDAVLLFLGEHIGFIRKAGTIYVNSAYWRGDYSLFPPPYELKVFKVDEPPF